MQDTKQYSPKATSSGKREINSILSHTLEYSAETLY